MNINEFRDKCKYQGIHIAINEAHKKTNIIEQLANLTIKNI